MCYCLYQWKNISSKSCCERIHNGDEKLFKKIAPTIKFSTLYKCTHTESSSEWLTLFNSFINICVFWVRCFKYTLNSINLRPAISKSKNSYSVFWIYVCFMYIRSGQKRLVFITAPFACAMCSMLTNRSRFTEKNSERKNYKTIK